MEVMFVSTETLAVLIALLSVFLTLGGIMVASFRWMDKRMESGFAKEREITNARFDQMDARFDQMDARFDQMDARMDRMDGRMDRMDDRFERIEVRLDKITDDIHEIRSDITETKISIARLEGPLPRFVAQR